jgi:hypothetical protein
MSVLFRLVLAVVSVFALSSAASASADDTSDDAYSQAESRFVKWLSDSAREGKRPSAEERRQKHREYFSAASRAYTDEARHISMLDDSTVTRDVKNYNPPAPKKGGVSADEPPAREDSDASNLRALSDLAKRSMATFGSDSSLPPNGAQVGAGERVHEKPAPAAPDQR